MVVVGRAGGAASATRRLPAAAHPLSYLPAPITTASSRGGIQYVPHQLARRCGVLRSAPRTIAAASGDDDAPRALSAREREALQHTLMRLCEDDVDFSEIKVWVDGCVGG